jgi:hypothetical protein
VKAQVEQTIIIHLTPNEAVWLKKHLTDPPSSEESTYDQKKRIELHSALHEVLNEIKY